MPIVVPDGLPAAEVLRRENVFTMSNERASSQDIRQLRVLILNLMPTKIATETQLLRLLGNTPLQVDVTLLRTATYEAKNTSTEHLLRFYETFADVRDQWFDGLIITGAPVERLDFEAVDYWPELVEILDWARTHVWSTLHICWGAQAGLYHYYGVPKREWPSGKKLSGVFEHRLVDPSHLLFHGFDDVFFAPHSRYTDVAVSAVETVPELEVLSVSDEAGLYAVGSRDGRQFFITGHSEYDRETLDLEYRRDLGALGAGGAGVNGGAGVAEGIEPPRHYYPNDDPDQRPLMRWHAHSQLLFANWLNFFVYQEVPYAERW